MPFRILLPDPQARYVRINGARVRHRGHDDLRTLKMPPLAAAILAAVAFSAQAPEMAGACTAWPCSGLLRVVRVIRGLSFSPGCQPRTHLTNRDARGDPGMDNVASEHRERATRTERAGEAARERACRGVRGAKPLGLGLSGAMNTEKFRKLCLSLPGATENVQWGNDLVFKVGGKMFAVAALDAEATHRASFKCTDESFAELQEIEGAVPAPYMARARWIAVAAWDTLPDLEIDARIRESHRLVFEKLTGKERARISGAKQAAPAQRRPRHAQASHAAEKTAS